MEGIVQRLVEDGARQAHVIVDLARTELRGGKRCDSPRRDPHAALGVPRTT
jgi:hypothetical protein